MKRGWLIRGFAALAGLAVLLALWLALKTPRQDREWQKDMAGLARVSDENGTLMIEPYRDWSWSGDGATAERWVQSPPFKIGDVRGAWLVVEPHPSMKIMAHTLVIFDFSGGALIGLSVEARKEKDETYSAFKGAFREYELSYQWASPHDLLTRRALTLKRELYAYPLVLSQVEAETYLTSVIARTRALETKPRFYNTLHSNCTNELAKSARLKWDPAFILTGRAAEALDRQGRISGEGDFAAKKERARIDEAVRAFADLDPAGFDLALRAELQAR